MSDFDIIKSTDIGIANPTGRMIDGKKECLLNANLVKPIILYSPSTLGSSIKYNGKNLISHINASLSTNSKPKVWYEVDSTRNSFGSSSINSICYGNGKFVAGGMSGKMAYSSDGITWTQVSDSPFGSSSIYSVYHGNGKFVAGGTSGKMAYSTDGVNWTAVTDSTFGNNTTIFSICYEKGKYVAVGGYRASSTTITTYHGKMAYSTDGVTWTSIDISAFRNYRIYSICYGNGKFVAVGGRPDKIIQGTSTGAGGKMAYSTDGVTWTEVTNSYFETSEIYSVYHGNGKFVAGGMSGKMAYSTDGVNWTEVDSPFGSSSIHSTYYGNGKFVAGGNGGKIAYSTDGITWTAVSNSTFGTNPISSICYGNGKYVAVGLDGKMAYCQVKVPE